MAKPRRADKSGTPERPPIVARLLEEVRRARGDRRIAYSRSKVATLRAFRRVRADRVFGVFGTVLVVVAVGLIFTWEKKPPEQVAVSLAWKEDDRSLPDQNQTLGSPRETQVYSFEVSDVNVTRVHVHLFWIDDVASGPFDWDNVSVRIDGPPETNVSRDLPGLAWTFQWGVNVSVNLRVQDTPQSPSQFQVRSEAEAEQLLGDRTGRIGTGIWRVYVTLEEAKGNASSSLTGSLACPTTSASVVCTPDPGNWVRVGLTYQTYRPEFRRIQP